MSETLIARPKGDVVEGHRILSEIGRGAASIIYLAQDNKTKQIWALKHVQVLTEKDRRFLDQAVQEQAIAQAFDHPAIRKIPRLIRKGTLLKTRELFLVMEYVDGVSMEKSPPGTFAAAVDIFRQVARALAHMHERGFVHADMKPNNVIVSAEGKAKIIDLGQSCKIGTIKGRIQGTPDYIAPEQVHRQEITPRTDVYNLGATLYWALTRKNIPTALGRGESLLGSIDGALLERPAAPIAVNPRVPSALSDLVMHCVEPQPEKRPDTMSAVVKRLDDILEALLAASAASPAARS